MRRTRVKKKRWLRPKLIVLIRSNSAEGVLQNCKSVGNGEGPQAGYFACVGPVTSWLDTPQGRVPGSCAGYCFSMGTS